ncbi:MAG: HepT-like ribonuclease domain-containing protein [Sulfuricurvum sp.]
MSKSKLEFILQMIDDIEYIVAQHNGIVTDALSHRISKPAILMSLLQIGEALGKMRFENELLNEYAKGAYNVRNFIAHDYEGVNMAIIENIVRTMLKPLKEVIVQTLKEK